MRASPDLPGRRQITPEGGFMSTLPAVTMQDLELEQAELLPSRETLCCHSGTRTSVNNVGLLNGNQILSGISVFGNGVAQNGAGNSALVL
jgi:hypothetical protein